MKPNKSKEKEAALAEFFGAGDLYDDPAAEPSSKPARKHDARQPQDDLESLIKGVVEEREDVVVEGEKRLSERSRNLKARGKEALPVQVDKPIYDIIRQASIKAKMQGKERHSSMNRIVNLALREYIQNHADELLSGE